MSGPLKKIRIGDMLVDSGLINAEQLEQALKEQKAKGGKLGDVVVHMGLVKEDVLLKTLASQLNVQYVDLDTVDIKSDVIKKIPERVARRFRVLCLNEIEGRYTIGMVDPSDVMAFDELTRLLGSGFQMAVVKESDLLKIIDKVYRRTQDIASFAEELKEELEDDEPVEGSGIVMGDEPVGEDAAPVAKLLDSIFEDAVQVGASDIHIEPGEKELRIRQRIDGVLQESIIPGKEIVAALVLRIKLLSKLNISEKRLPQDGRFQVNIKGRKIDVRVSTMPVRHGESVVMRLLDQSKGILSLDEVGMETYALERLRYHIKRPSGLILVTGPTGSGKTTTLYASLNEMNVEGKKIITIEDPVEYVLPRIQQVQVNQQIDLTFARVLRSALRQDPDIVMVGEMRDEETATIGLRAAMTGHLVLSTLHTNDSVSTALRLIDMGAEGYLVAGALRLVLAQRLVRRICDSCVEPYTLTPEEKELVTMLKGDYESGWSFKHGKGCSQCNDTGYSGRIGVYEILEMNMPLADALRENDSKAFADIAYNQENFKPLAQSAFDYALSGLTAVSEVFRIAAEIEDVRQLNMNKKESGRNISRISV